MVRSSQIAASQVIARAAVRRSGGWPARGPSTNTASSIDRSPVHSMPGVGHTLRNVSDALSSASAHTSAIHRQGRLVVFDNLSVTSTENDEAHGLYRQDALVSALDRALGLARSLLVYHGIPGRQRRMRRLYSRFVAAGDLAFDVGAHAGQSHTRPRGAGMPRRRPGTSAGLRPPAARTVRALARRHGRRGRPQAALRATRAWP